MGINRLVGTPWHTEKITRAEGDDRRHKSWCLYYIRSGKLCKRTGNRCKGSAHCEKYYERPDRNEADNPSVDRKGIDIKKKASNSQIHNSSVQKSSKASKDNTNSNIKSRSKTNPKIHEMLESGKTVKHKIYGKGEIVSVDNDKLIIRFDVGEKMFPLTAVQSWITLDDDC